MFALEQRQGKRALTPDAPRRYDTPTRSATIRSVLAQQKQQTLQRVRTLEARAADIVRTATACRGRKGYHAFCSSTYRCSSVRAAQAAVDEKRRRARGGGATKGSGLSPTMFGDSTAPIDEVIALCSDTRDPRLVAPNLRVAFNSPMVVPQGFVRVDSRRPHSRSNSPFGNRSVSLGGSIATGAASSTRNGSSVMSPAAASHHACVTGSEPLTDGPQSLQEAIRVALIARTIGRRSASKQQVLVVTPAGPSRDVVTTPLNSEAATPRGGDAASSASKAVLASRIAALIDIQKRLAGAPPELEGTAAAALNQKLALSPPDALLSLRPPPHVGMRAIAVESDLSEEDSSDDADNRLGRQATVTGSQRDRSTTPSGGEVSPPFRSTETPPPTEGSFHGVAILAPAEPRDVPGLPHYPPNEPPHATAPPEILSASSKAPATEDDGPIGHDAVVREPHALSPAARLAALRATKSQSSVSCPPPPPVQAAADASDESAVVSPDFKAMTPMQRLKALKARRDDPDSAASSLEPAMADPVTPAAAPIAVVAELHQRTPVDAAAFAVATAALEQPDFVAMTPMQRLQALKARRDHAAAQHAPPTPEAEGTPAARPPPHDGAVTPVGTATQRTADDTTAIAAAAAAVAQPDFAAMTPMQRLQALKARRDHAAAQHAPPAPEAEGTPAARPPPHDGAVTPVGTATQRTADDTTAIAAAAAAVEQPDFAAMTPMQRLQALKARRDHAAVIPSSSADTSAPSSKVMMAKAEEAPPSLSARCAPTAQSPAARLAAIRAQQQATAHP